MAQDGAATVRLVTARRALDEVNATLGLVASEPGRRARDRIPTGVAALDEALGGGLPRGRLIELSGARSSGRMALALQFLGEATGRGEPAALVDLPDALDPRDLPAAQRARVLWVRPTSLLAALQSVDLLLDAGGFALVGVYLVGTLRERAGGGEHGAPGALRRVPASAWARLCRRAEASGTSLLVVTDGTPAQSPGAFASVAMTARRRRAVWTGGRRLLDVVEGELVLLRHREGPPRAEPIPFRRR